MIEQAATAGAVGNFRVMSANQGVHSPIDWAMTTAEMLMCTITVAPYSPNKDAIALAKEKTFKRLIPILIDHNVLIQGGERARVARGRFVPGVLDPMVHTNVDVAVDDVFRVMSELLSNPVLITPGIGGGVSTDMDSARAHLRVLISERLMQDFRTIMQIERDHVFPVT